MNQRAKRKSKYSTERNSSVFYDVWASHGTAEYGCSWLSREGNGKEEVVPQRPMDTKLCECSSPWQYSVTVFVNNMSILYLQFLIVK